MSKGGKLADQVLQFACRSYQTLRFAPAAAFDQCFSTVSLDSHAPSLHHGAGPELCAKRKYFPSRRTYCGSENPANLTSFRAILSAIRLSLEICRKFV